MLKFASLFTDSLKEFRKTKTITICAMMAALSLILSNFSVMITPDFKVGVSGIPNELVDMMFGPVVGMAFGGGMNLIKFFIKPDGAFFFGYTLTAIVGGLIYGLCYYKKPVRLWRVLLGHLLVIWVCNVGMNSLWSVMMSGGQKAFLVIAGGKIVTNMVQWPVKSFLFYLVFKAFETAGIFRFVKTGSFAQAQRQA